MYSMLTGLGLGIITGTTLYVLFQIFNQRPVKVHPLISENRTNQQAGVIGVIVFGLIFIWLNNLLTALLATIIIVFLPFQIEYMRKRRLRRQVLEQLALAVSLFANTFAATKNIPRSIETVGKRLPEPLGGFFSSAYTELAFGTPLEKVTDSLAQKIGLSHGYIFAQMLKNAQNHGEIIAPLFYSLARKINASQEQENLKTAELSGIRITNIILLILPIPLFLFLNSRFDEMAIFMNSTAGRVLFTFWLFSIIAWFFMDRLVVDN